MLPWHAVSSQLQGGDNQQEDEVERNSARSPEGPACQMLGTLPWATCWSFKLTTWSLT